MPMCVIQPKVKFTDIIQIVKLDSYLNASVFFNAER